MADSTTAPVSNIDNIAELRKNYGLAALDEADVCPDPTEQFRIWFEQALQAEVPEPNAMTLATVSSTGRPSARIVLIKHFDEHGLTWFTNYLSRKGSDLDHHPWAALQFHWVEMERVVRVEGRVHKVTAQESDAYFHSRPLASRWGAWASPQSSVVTSRQILENSMAQAQVRYGDDPPRPDHWGGFRLVPDRWEFWQGRPSRLHDRIQYQRQSGHGPWHKERLAP